MPETEAIEAMKKKEEKKNRKQKETLLLFGLLLAILAGVVGFAVGYHQGAFEGYQLALKQFHIIAADLPRLLP